MAKTLMPTPDQDKDFDFTNERKHVDLDIAAYYYRGGTVCSHCLRERIVPYWTIPKPGGSTTEDILDGYAEKLGIDRDKGNFPSYDFPHRMAPSELMDSDRCYVCRRTF